MPRKRIILNRSRRKKNKRVNNAVVSIIVCLLGILVFSVIFSLINMGNSNIIKNIKIEEIDVSNLSQEEAKEKIQNWYNKTILKDVTAEYEDVKENISIEQMDSSINIDKAVQNACVVGKSGNILKDNYDILSTLLFTKTIDCKIEYDQKQLEKKIEELNLKLPNTMIESNYYIDGNKLVIKKGKVGIQIDEAKFKNEFDKTILAQENRKFKIPTKEVRPKEINIEKIHDEVYKKVQDASIKDSPIEVKPEVVGVDFEITIEEAKKILKEEKEEYIIPLKITIPQITLETLGTKAFPEKLGEYSTTYSTSNENRITNLKLASEKINGTVILPGEIFSYNKIVGERTIAKGYKEAAVYSGGKVVDGIGGGICQISSTLYNAALYANMQIMQRSNHQFLTSYVTAGRDATVSWGTIDFCFKNTRKYPIKIKSEVKNGVVTAEIDGIKEKKEYEVSIESTITQTLPFTTKYVNDSELPQGTEKIIQYGANGAKSETYKIIKENGIIISRQMIASDIYSPLERIVKKGVKKVKGVNAEPIEEKNEELSEIKPELLDLIKELE